MLAEITSYCRVVAGACVEDLAFLMALVTGRLIHEEIRPTPSMFWGLAYATEALFPVSRLTQRFRQSGSVVCAGVGSF